MTAYYEELLKTKVTAALDNREATRLAADRAKFWLDELKAHSRPTDQLSREKLIRYRKAAEKDFDIKARKAHAAREAWQKAQKELESFTRKHNKEIAGTNPRGDTTPPDNAAIGAPQIDRQTSSLEGIAALTNAAIAELRLNLETAKNPWSGNMLEFQTTIWRRDGFKALSGSDRQTIDEAYVDIGLANNLVWLTNEMSVRDTGIEESYRQLCAKIVQRLYRLKL